MAEGQGCVAHHCMEPCCRRMRFIWGTELELPGRCHLVGLDKGGMGMYEGNYDGFTRGEARRFP